MYDAFFDSVLGDKYVRYIPIINNLNLYCLFVMTIVIASSVYFVHHYIRDCENTFVQRVKKLRLKYNAI